MRLRFVISLFLPIWAAIFSAPAVETPAGLSGPRPLGITDPITQIHQLTTAFDGLGNRTEYNRTAPLAYEKDFGYDALDRLITTAITPTGLAARSSRYDLDAANNRTYAELKSTVDPAHFSAYEYTIDEMNQPTNVDHVTAEGGCGGGPCDLLPKDDLHGALVFDPAGNMTSRGRGETAADVYKYDFLNRLADVVLDDGTRIKLRYDALGRLVERWKYDDEDELLSAREFLWDGWRMIEERDLTLAATPELSLRAMYFYGSDGLQDVVMMRVWDDPADPEDFEYGDYSEYFLHRDDMDSVVMVTDKQGEPVEYYEYDDFGARIVRDASGTVIANSVIGNPFGYTGQRYDEDLKLYYCRYRWYDPFLGRFINRDPLGIWGDALNLGNGSAYVGNSPWGYMDPYGLCQGVLDTNLSVKEALSTTTPWVLAHIRTNQALDPTGGDLFRLLNLEGGALEEELRRQEFKGDLNETIEKLQLAAEMAELIAVAAVTEVATAGVTPVAEIAAGKLAAKAGDVYKGVKALASIGRGAEDAAEAAALVTKLDGPAGAICELGAAKEATNAERLVIGRGADLAKPGALSPGEFKLGWTPTSTVQSEWKVNSGLLRQEMRNMRPIRDASSQLDTKGMYLNAERNLLKDRDGSLIKARAFGCHPLIDYGY